MTLDELMGLDREDVRRIVARSEDAEALADLFREASAQRADLRDDIASFRTAGTADRDWLRRAGGRLSMLTKIRRWAAERMEELGAQPPWSRSDRRNEEVLHLEHRIHALKETILQAGLELPR